MTVPYTSGTANLLSPEHLRHMKKSAFLIHLPRGVTIGWHVLASMPSQGALVGAALGLFEAMLSNPHYSGVFLNTLAYPQYLIGQHLLEHGSGIPAGY